MFAKYSPALLHMVQNNSFSGRASCLRRVHIKNSPGAHDYLNPPLFVCVTKLLFDQVFISLFSGSAAMFYLNSCLQDFAFNMFFFFYMFTMCGYRLITIVCSTNLLLFSRLHFIYINLRSLIIFCFRFECPVVFFNNKYRYTGTVQYRYNRYNCIPSTLYLPSTMWKRLKAPDFLN